MFIDPIVGKYSDICELVGLCDTSETRRKYHQSRLVKQYGCASIPLYEDFDLMLRETKPDTVVVCTPDHTHHEFIIKSLASGIDVISEKPLTTDEQKCREICDAVKKFGGKVRTTFNLRWSPGAGKVREIIAAGVIGRVKHVAFEYFLNTSHGADYFRRWHSQKKYSGGLLVHKSTHHFDLINWWADSIPSEVFAMGELAYYGRKNALERGDGNLAKYPRYTGVPEAESDPFRLAIDEDETLRDLYLNAEKDSGYIRDQNVFRDGIDIEDSMSVLIRYRSGVIANYSLNAFSPREGFRVSISGDRGRIDYHEDYGSHLIGEALNNNLENPIRSLTVQPLFSSLYEVEIPAFEGGHGGGDPLIQEQMFAVSPARDTLMRNAGHEQGAASMLIGVAANKSIDSHLPVKIDDLMLLNASAQKLSDLI